MSGLNSPMWALLGPLLLVVCIILLLNFMEHRVVVPTINRMKMKRLTNGCLGKHPGISCGQPIGVVVVCHGHIASTARQVVALFCQAANPLRLEVVVVSSGRTQPQVASLTGPKSLMDVIMADQRVQGISTVLQLRDHIRIVTPPAPLEGLLTGSLVALGRGLQEFHASSPAVEFVAFFGPTMAPTRDWDSHGVDTLRKLVQTHQDRVIVSYGSPSTPSTKATKRAKPHPTFPVLNFHGGNPMVTWQSFAERPTTTHPTKLVSSDFLMVPLAAIPEEVAATLMRMPCPPRFADIVLSSMLFNLHFRAFVPPTAVAVAQFSDNCAAYMSDLAHDASCRTMNVATTKAVLASLRGASSQPFVQDFLGLDMAAAQVRKDAVMGTLPPNTMFDDALLRRDVELKYTSAAGADRVWAQVRGRVNVVPADE